jgi:hypothetical protein
VNIILQSDQFILTRCTDVKDRSNAERATLNYHVGVHTFAVVSNKWHTCAGGIKNREFRQSVDFNPCLFPFPDTVFPVKLHIKGHFINNFQSQWPEV